MALHITMFSRRAADEYGGAPVLRPDDKLGSFTLAPGAAVVSEDLHPRTEYVLLTPEEDCYFDIATGGNVAGLSASTGILLLAADGARVFGTTPSDTAVIGVVER